MFEKPSDPRSGSYAKRLAAWELLTRGVALGETLRAVEREQIQNLVASELREAEFELSRLLSGVEWALSHVRREQGIRLEQSHDKNGAK